MEIRFDYSVHVAGFTMTTPHLNKAKQNLELLGPGIIIRVKEEREGPGHPWIPVLAEQMP